MPFTPEQLAQLEQVIEKTVERVVKKALAEEPSLRRMGEGNLLSLIELRLNQFLAESRDISRKLSTPRPGSKHG